MPATDDAARSARFLRMLGDELRRARRRRNWRRRDMRERLGGTLSVQAIATYELGSRACTVARLLELTDVLEVYPPDLIARALDRIAYRRPPTLVVDLVAIARSSRAELQPFRRWATAWLAHLGHHDSTLLRLSPPAIYWLAEVCGLDQAELLTQIETETLVDG